MNIVSFSIGFAFLFAINKWLLPTKYKLALLTDICSTQIFKLVIMKGKLIKLGTLNVNEMTILEWKPIFSLKTFYFHPGTAQEIFHTHSFSAISFLIYGNYIEAFCDPIHNKYWEEPRNRSRLIYIPKDRFHQITKSEGCRTVMLTGPWGDTYKEYKPETRELIVSTHGRREIRRDILFSNIG